MDRSEDEPPTTVETSAGRMTMRDDGIIHWTSRQDSHETTATAKECIAGIERMSPGKRVPYLADIRRVRTAERGARREFAGENMAAVVTRIGLVIDSGLSKVVGNFFLGLNKPLVPTRLFTSIDAAVAWLAGGES